MHEFHTCVQNQANAKTCNKGGLTDALALRLDELFSKYETPWASSAYGKLLGKTADVKGHLDVGIARVQDVGQSMEELEKKSADMANNARSFNKTAGVAKWRYQLEKYRF